MPLEAWRCLANLRKNYPVLLKHTDGSLSLRNVVKKSEFMAMLNSHMPNFAHLVDDINTDSVKTGDFMDALKQNGGMGSLDLHKTIDRAISALGQKSVLDGVEGLGAMANILGKINNSQGIPDILANGSHSANLHGSLQNNATGN